MRPKVAEDISKPLQNSFIHAGHGAAFGESWGNPAYIDDMYLCNPMEPPDVLGLKRDPVTTPQLSDRRKKSLRSPVQSVLRKPSTDQFNYKRLTNESKGKPPVRPPQPIFKNNIEKQVAQEQKEGVLIDFSPEDGVAAPRINMSNNSLQSQISLLDQPIDIPQEDEDFSTPSYCNISESNVQLEGLDPFDTSNVYTTTSHRYYSHVNQDYSTYSNLYNQEHYTDISHSSPDLHQMFNEQIKNTNVQQSEKDINEQINAISLREPQSKVNDAKFLEDLKKRLEKKESGSSHKNLSVKSEENLLLGIDDPVSNIVPMLKPPLQLSIVKNTNVTMLPCKVQNTWSSKSVNLDASTSLVSEDRLYDNMSKSNPNVQDTTTVFNRIWYERAVKDNVNTKNFNGHVDTDWSDNVKQSPNLYGSIQSPIVSVKSEYGEFKCNQRNVPETSNYNSSLPTNSNSSQNFLLNQYGNPVQVLPDNPHSHRYNQIPENIYYSEVPDYIYSQPMKEKLMPHRPAPPSPMVLGYPQSMQQLQRKLGGIQTTQV